MVDAAAYVTSRLTLSTFRCEIYDQYHNLADIVVKPGMRIKIENAREEVAVTTAFNTD